MASPCTLETVWFDKYKYDDAELQCQEHLANPIKANAGTGGEAKTVSTSLLVGEIARARQHIKHSLQSGDHLGATQNASSSDTDRRLQALENENKEMKALLKELQSQVSRLESHLTSIDSQPKKLTNSNDIKAAPKAQKITNSVPETENDDDIDLFGSDDEADDEANTLREKRLQEYSTKKSKKPQLIAKSSVVLDIKPWDDETDMQEMEKKVRTIAMDGLLWGASKLVPLAYGIKKLQIVSVVEDDKVSIEELQEVIAAFEDYVQSVDIAAFNKI